MNQTLLHRTEEMNLNVKGIEAKTDANALKIAFGRSSGMGSPRPHDNVSSFLVRGARRGGKEQ